MKHLRAKIFAIRAFLGGFLFLFILPQQLAAQEKVFVAIQPTISSDAILTKSKPLQKFIQEKLGDEVKVEIYVPTSYAAVVESVRFGHAHVAFMSAWPAQLAVQKGGADVVLAEVRRVIHGDKQVEAPYYYSYWVVLRNSPYQDLQSLKDKSACFSSPISTSGYVAPVGRLTELNLLQTPKGKEANPKAFFKEVLFGGGYSQCWQALKRGQVDTTIIAGDVPEKLYNEVLSSTRTVEQQGPVPSHAVVFSKELKEPLRSRVAEAIIELGDPGHRSLMQSFISSIFVGFKRTTAAEHLGTLTRYLKLANLKYVERM